MPELPEVQTIVDGLKEHVLNQKILKVEIFEPKTLASDCKKKLEGQVICQLKRLGKYIIFDLSHIILVVHLRMTGQFFYYKDDSFTVSPYDRVCFQLERGFLVFRDVRKFGTMALETSIEKALAHIGPDAMSSNFTKQVLIKICKSTSRAIKAVLLDQTKLAGLGNIYADEALFASLIHPSSKACAIPDERLDRLYDAILDVLQKGLASKGTSIGSGLGNYKHINGQGKNQNGLAVYGKKGQCCPLCKHEFFKSQVASRGTTFCPHCQKLYS